MTTYHRCTIDLLCHNLAYQVGALARVVIYGQALTFIHYTYLAIGIIFIKDVIFLENFMSEL